MNKTMKKLSRVECLMTYVRGFCDQQRGRKALLARYLGVRPHMISAWLDGVRPNAEHALGMVEWMHKQTQTQRPAVPRAADDA